MCIYFKAPESMLCCTTVLPHRPELKYSQPLEMSIFLMKNIDFVEKGVIVHPKLWNLIVFRFLGTEEFIFY